MVIWKRIRALWLLLLVATVADAQQAGPPVFVPFGQLEAKLDDRPLEDGELFFAERAGGYLVLSSELDPPLLINVRTQQVESLKPAGIRRNEDGTISLTGNARVGIVGPFQVEGLQLTATLEAGRKLILSPKPDLLGRQTAESVIAHDPSYGFHARRYPPSEKTLDLLRQEARPVTVTVYFGSWCATCRRVLPWLLSVDQGLAGSNIRFEYFGLPHSMEDPEAEKMGVESVPTAVVSADGKELGRRSSQGLGIPEKALLEILGGD